MHRCIFAFSLIITFLALVQPVLAADESEMIDSIAATVENETITLEDVRLEKDLLKRTGVWFSRTKPETTPTDKMVFEEIMVRILLYHQARKMGFSDVPPARLAARMKSFRTSFGNEESYREWLLKMEYRDEAVPIPDNIDYQLYRSISKRFFRELAIEQYLEKKIGIQVKLALADYLEEEGESLRTEHPGASEEDLEQHAREAIYRKKLDQHINELKKRARIIILRELFR